MKSKRKSATCKAFQRSGMKSGGFMLINNGKAQFCHIMSADYDICEFSVNGGKAQKMARDFSVEIDSGKLVSEVA